VESLAVSADGRLIAVGGWDGALEIREVSSGRRLWRRQGHIGPVRGLAFSGDGRLLISGGWDGTVRMWGVLR
jgi:WD40 repeat protein